MQKWPEWGMLLITECATLKYSRNDCHLVIIRCRRHLTKRDESRIVWVPV